MFERFDLSKTVRYGLTAVVAGLAMQIATGRPDAGECGKLFWAVARSAPLFAALCVVALLVGYFLFNVYRGGVYELLLIPFKGVLGRRLGVRTYREFLREVVLLEGSGRINDVQAERLYMSIKCTDLRDFYSGVGSSISTGVHFLYFSSIAMLVASVVNFSQARMLTLAATTLLAVSVIIDWNFAKLELLLFARHRVEIETLVRSLIGNGAFHPLGARLRDERVQADNGKVR
ncbi:MAG: hypothetical protein QOC81_3493 [Thermoanaerobaculia bacterium]|jgi:hypothetical protein|nr:hypothetical protein [Thermoanaerobaculia bacterium]